MAASGGGWCAVVSFMLPGCPAGFQTGNRHAGMKFGDVVACQPGQGKRVLRQPLLQRMAITTWPG
jgi:hypothetical protein